MKALRRCLPVALLTVLLASFANAQVANAHGQQWPSGAASVVVYTDSFGDNGNIYKLFNFPGPPYWHGRWSNGPVAPETLAFVLGLPLIDDAFAAATTGVGNLIDGGTTTMLGSDGLPGITTAYQTTIGSLSPQTIRDSLFLVYGGFNDFSSDGLTAATAEAGAANIVAIVVDLQRRGAKRILVPGLFDMGMTPYYSSQGPDTAALATSLSKHFNQKLLASLPRGATYFDAFGLYQQIKANPVAFGYSNITDQCYDPSTNTACADPFKYLFWDFVHLTEHGQLILAGEYALAIGGAERR